MRTTSFFLLSALCLPLLHCGGDDKDDASTPAPTSLECTEGPAPSQVAGFSRISVGASLSGPSFAAAGDVNGDGKGDLVLSEFGTVDSNNMMLSTGRISVYYQGSGLNCWHRQEIVGADAGLYFPNQTVLADVDKDGDLDVIVPSGFFVCSLLGPGDCGGLAWYENTGNDNDDDDDDDDDNESDKPWTRHDLVAKGAPQFYHSAVLVDMDGDGIDDLVTVGETSSSAQAQWFKGDTSPDRFAKSPAVIGDGLGSFPSVLDIDGDGDLDLGSAEYFVNNGGFAWLEQTAPGVFAHHVINSDSARSIMLRFVPDFYGDGVLRAVGSNHTNTTRTPPDPESGVFVFDVPADPTALWPKKLISTGIVSRPSVGVGFQAAPGIFGAGDVDGDGDLDLAVAGDGDLRTFWLEQTAPGVFTTHVIEESLGQASGTQIQDLDGDGKNEVVFTGFEDNALYLYTHGG